MKATEIEIFHHSDHRTGGPILDRSAYCLFRGPADLFSQRLIDDIRQMIIGIVVSSVNRCQVRFLEITPSYQLHLHCLYEVEINWHSVQRNIMFAFFVRYS